jgi:hypothetical protein
MPTPQKVGPPQELAEAHRYLIQAFVLHFCVSFVPGFVKVVAMAREEPVPGWYTTLEPVLAIGGILTSVLLVAALYVAAKRIGLSTLSIVIALIIAWLVDIFGLILLVSVDLRIARHLKAQGWKIGLLGATKT